MVQLSDNILQPTAINLSNYLETSASFWEPVESQPIVDWVHDKLRFGMGQGLQLESKVGRYTFDDRPWWTFPLECSADKDCLSIAMPASTQIGKTAGLLMAHMLWTAEFRPAPGMVILPDELESKKFRDRIYGIVEESTKFNSFQRISIPEVHKWNLQEINLGSMLIHIAWAGSRQRTRGKPCWYVWFTECDVYRDRDQKAGDAIEAGKQRTKDVFRPKHIFESSPSESPSAISGEEELSDERWRWYFSCPECQALQEARFFPFRKGALAGKGGIEITARAMGSIGNDLMSPKEAREHAYYICIKGCKLHDSVKQEMIENGDWYPKGWKEGDPEPDRRPARKVGFHLWAIHSPNETFTSLAEDYLNHLIKGLKIDFYSNRLAISYEGDAKTRSWSELGRRAAYTNARRTVPQQCWFLTCGTDVQGENNGVRYVIRGWGPGRTSYLIDWGWLERHPDDENELIKSDLVQLEQQTLYAKFPVVNQTNQPSKNPAGLESMQVRLLNIDTNHLPKKVHQWMRHLPTDWVDQQHGSRIDAGRVRAIRGSGGLRPDVRFKHSLVDTNAGDGSRYEGGLHLWSLNVYPYYGELLELISGEPGQLGSWHVTSDALSQGRSYLEQMTNFQYTVVYDPKKGKKGVWGPRAGRIPVDYWDCEVYAMSAAEMVVGALGWNESDWIRVWQTDKKPRKQITARQAQTEEIGIGDR